MWVWIVIWSAILNAIICTEVDAYALEICLNGRRGPELWPIVFEYDDPGSFKSGNLSYLSSMRLYVNLLLTPYGSLMTPYGNLTGFDEHGNWGVSPTDTAASTGYSIENLSLKYNGTTNWRACPLQRQGNTIFTIQWNSNCTGGFDTNITVVDTVSVSISAVGQFTSNATPTTSLSENSFNSLNYSTTTDSSAHTSLYFSFLTTALVLMFYWI